MKRLLFVKSGPHARPVTGYQEITDEQAGRLIGTSRLRFLGTQLPVLVGSGNLLPDFVRPDHVVLELPADGIAAEWEGAGFYLIPDLHPEDVKV